MILTHGMNSIRNIEDITLIIDGRTYPVVIIGNQAWMAENLDWKIDGFLIGPQNWQIEVPAAWYYDNNESTYGINGRKYGLLYNGYAVEEICKNSANLLPKGWRVPSPSDFDTLAETVGESTASQVLKSNEYWVSYGRGTNEYGFTAFPSGRFLQGSFYFNDSHAEFATSDFSSSFTTTRYLNALYSLVQSGGTEKKGGSSIRLCKDV